MDQKLTNNTDQIDTETYGLSTHALSDLGSRIDWARVCGRGDFDQVRAVFETWFSPVEIAGRGRGYLQQIDSSTSATLLLGMTQCPEAWQVDIPGQALAWIGTQAQQESIRSLLSLPGSRVTRLDAAIDLRGSGLAQVLASAARANLDELWRRGGKNIHGVGPDGGTTVQIGSVTSPNYVRFYDKGAEQGISSMDWLRWEAQFNRAHAEKIGPMLLERDDWPALAQELAAGAIRNLESKSPELYKLLKSDRTITLEADQKSRDWDRYCDWLHGQVFPTLALVAEATGLPIIEVLRQTGVEKASPPARRNRHSGLITGAIDALIGTIPACQDHAKDIA